MLAEEDKPIPTAAATPAPAGRLWLRLLVGALLMGLTLWFVLRDVSVGDLWAALQTADNRWIAAGVGAILLVNVAKTWRWQLLFYPRTTRPPFRPTFWALMLGQVVNNLSPVRLGELARVYYLHRANRTSRGQSLGTMVVEKNLDMLILVLTILVILPWVVVPQSISNPVPTLATIAVGLLVILYLLAYRADWIVRVIGRIAAWLPESAEKRVMRLASSSLHGLAALRSRHTAAQLVISSALVGAAMLLTPWCLFQAFALPYGIVEAALVHIGLMLGLTLPTPAKIGVFEASVVVMLRQVGMADESLMLGYAIVFHIVSVLPQIVLGGVAALNSDWNWRDALSSPPLLDES